MKDYQSFLKLVQLIFLQNFLRGLFRAFQKFFQYIFIISAEHPIRLHKGFLYYLLRDSFTIRAETLALFRSLRTRQIVFLCLELLCQRLRERLPPQNPHSNIQLKAYFRLNFFPFSGVTPCLRFPFRRLLISCALANISSEIIGSW